MWSTTTFTLRCFVFFFPVVCLNCLLKAVVPKLSLLPPLWFMRKVLHPDPPKQIISHILTLLHRKIDKNLFSSKGYRLLVYCLLWSFGVISKCRQKTISPGDRCESSTTVFFWAKIKYFASTVVFNLLFPLLDSQPHSIYTFFFHEVTTGFLKNFIQENILRFNQMLGPIKQSSRYIRNSHILLFGVHNNKIFLPKIAPVIVP